MNINQAKNYIKNDVRLYLKKNEYGEYRIPLVRQRPIFLLGAPGIGKTAIMEQVAEELQVALVSSSMTHHTRQSALGLPFIRHKEYEGMEYDVSEYTMSEIIASIYDVMEQSGVKEGILFLDEINCVSETLAPSMLQFLQYKVFGRHKVPEGWVIVTAGNPPEYNKSVREFDVVGNEFAVLVALFLAPAVVYNDILITRVFQTLGYHCVNRRFNKFLVYFPRESVPRIPPHRRSKCQIFVLHSASP